MENSKELEQILNELRKLAINEGSYVSDPEAAQGAKFAQILELCIGLSNLLDNVSIEGEGAAKILAYKAELANLMEQLQNGGADGDIDAIMAQITKLQE